MIGTAIVSGTIARCGKMLAITISYFYWVGYLQAAMMPSEFKKNLEFKKQL